MQQHDYTPAWMLDEHTIVRLPESHQHQVAQFSRLIRGEALFKVAEGLSESDIGRRLFDEGL